MRAGDLIDIDFGDPIGSEAGFVHPAVVVTADITLQALPRTFQVVPLTSNVERRLPTDVAVVGPAVASVAQCHLLTTVPIEAVGATYGNVGPVVLSQVREVLADLLDL